MMYARMGDKAKANAIIESVSNAPAATHLARAARDELLTIEFQEGYSGPLDPHPRRNALDS